MSRLRIKIDLGNNVVLGPGKVELLGLVDKYGSIRKAAAAMDMSYRRAWLLLKELETVLGAPAVTAETGGSKGGGTRLTELGRAIVERFHAIEKRAAQAVASDIRNLTRLSRASGKVRPGK